jgi:hypothetical protein
MKRHTTTPHLLLAGILFSGCMQVAIAAPPGPAPKPVAAKPKLAPRPLPGMSGNSVAGPSQVRAAAPIRKVNPAALAAAAAGDGADQARIVMIYRRGSAELPATAPLPSAPSQSVDIVQPVNMSSAPRDGEVRIITKEEAEKFVVKP